MVLFQLSRCIVHPEITIKGGKTSIFFRLMHWILGLNAKNKNKIE